MSEVNRRYFLMSSGLARRSSAGSSGLCPLNGANNRVRVAIIGVMTRWRAHPRLLRAEQRQRRTGCALRRGSTSVLNQRLSRSGSKIRQEAGWLFTDMRKVFDDKSIDAVSFATPNHWHALGTIWACRKAGKDVYGRKTGVPQHL